MLRPRSPEFRRPVSDAAFCDWKAQSSQSVSASRSAASISSARPYAQARRRIAIGANVIGDAFLFQNRHKVLREICLGVVGQEP